MGATARRGAVAGGIGLAGAYIWTAGRYRRTTAEGLRVDRPPPPGSPEFARLAVGDVLGGFLESWSETSGGVPTRARFPELEPLDDGVPVQITRSSPLGGDTAVAQLFQVAIASARERIWMTTAYFTAGRRFLDALCDAAARGVDVRILVNGQAVDKEVVRKTGQHSYGRLLEAGVRIFEYDRTMLHAKTIVVDADWASFGSSNFDHRSFALDAELNVSIYDREAAGVLADHFLDDVKGADEIDLDRWRSRPLRLRALELTGELARHSF